MRFSLKDILCRIMGRNKISCGKIGLALGSGSARGWAHIGVIRALEEAGVQIDYIAGTSIGAVVGAVYASGNLDALEEVTRQFDWKQIASFMDIVIPKSGLIDGKKVSAFIRSHVEEVNIEDLQIPFSAIATDLNTGREIIINKGDIIEAVRASVSVPGIFTPVKRNGTFLVNGGLVNPVPVSVLREMGAEYVIAVDLNHDITNSDFHIKTESAPEEHHYADGEEHAEKKNKMLEALNRRVAGVDWSAIKHVKSWMSTGNSLPGIFEVLTSSINVVEAKITATNLITDPPDLLIQPNLGHLRFLDFNRASEAIEEGYRAAKKKIDDL